MGKEVAQEMAQETEIREGRDAGATAPAQAAVGLEDDGGYRAAFDRALRLLGQREHSLRELKDKLVRKGIDRHVAELVTDDLRGRGLQSDVRFAESLVRGRVSRGHGPLRIRQELAKRGVDEAVADEVMTETAGHWLGLAADARRRKFGDSLPADREAWNRQARFLAQRGYPSDLIYRVLDGRGD
jgi:regulatory protein